MKKGTTKTPRSKIRAALRQLWLRSRERATSLKSTGYCCSDCGVKQSKAKGREVSLQVHHEPAIDWDGVIDLIQERLLQVNQEPLCKLCHGKRHDKNGKVK